MKGEPYVFRRLVSLLRKIPGIGEISARRLALFFLSQDISYVSDLADSLKKLKSNIRLCQECFNIADDRICSICRDSSRSGDVLCVVEDIQSLITLEKSMAYNGKYHILHGAISPIDGIGPEELKIKELFERVKKKKFGEIIIATSSTVEGETTALYISRELKKMGFYVTRPAHGIPSGANIAFMDRDTIEMAMKNRIKI